MKYSVGDDIVSCSPYVHVLHGHMRATYCEECFLNTSEVKRCSLCGIIPYCSVPCQRKAWKIHKLECKFLKACHPRIPDSSCRLFFQILIRNRCGLESTKRDGCRQFSDLQSNVEHVRNDGDAMMRFVSLITIIRQYGSAIIDVPNEDNLLDIFGKMQTNCYEITNESLTGVGIGLFLDASVFDHSCVPNAVSAFKGKNLKIKAVKEIESIDNVRVTYCDTMQSCTDRNKELKVRYYFSCACERCAKGVDADMFVRCQNSGCDGPVMMKELHCDVCNVTSVMDTVQLDDFRRLLLERLKTIDSRIADGEFETAADVCISTLKHDCNRLHSFDVDNAQVIERLFNSLYEGGKFDDAFRIATGEKLEKIYQMYYGPRHPKCYRFYLDMGHCCRAMGDYQMARTYFTNAWEVYRVSGFVNSKTVQELKHFIVECSL